MEKLSFLEEGKLISLDPPMQVPIHSHEKLELPDTCVPKLELGNKGESWSLGTRGKLELGNKGEAGAWEQESLGTRKLGNKKGWEQEE